jgi:hypothetical protein
VVAIDREGKIQSWRMAAENPQEPYERFKKGGLKEIMSGIEKEKNIEQSITGDEKAGVSHENKDKSYGFLGNNRQDATVSQPLSSTGDTEIDNSLLSNIQLERLSENELKNLVEKINNELEKRKSKQSSSSHEVSSQQLQTQLQEAKSLLQTSLQTPNDEPNAGNLPVIPIVSVIGIVSLLGLITYKVKKNKIKN